MIRSPTSKPTPSVHEAVTISMTAHEQFAHNVRRRRTEAGLSQEDVARAAEIHATEVSRLERNVHEPRLSTLLRLARGLGVKPAELLDGIE